MDEFLEHIRVPHFSNFGSLKSTETDAEQHQKHRFADFSNFGSLKSTETEARRCGARGGGDFSNFGSLKSTETGARADAEGKADRISAISAR